MSDTHRIVAFTKDWDDVPTCTTHILREMGKTIPVLWVNSIGTRKPRLSHPSHLGRLLKRLVGGTKRAQRKEHLLRVLHPLLIPKAQSRITRWINRRLFSWQAGRELQEMGDGPIEYWCFVPNAVDLVPGVRRQASGVRSQGPGVKTRAPNVQCPVSNFQIVYYCVDDWTKFQYLDTEWMAQKERELLARADAVFAVSRYLEEKLRQIAENLPQSEIRNPESGIHYSPHGVEYRKFRSALSIQTLPRDVAGIRPPRIGFYGNIYPWVDLHLVAELARRRPDWSLILIGGVFCDIARFQALGNVHFLGRREHDDLPRYCAAFDVAMIPYDMADPRMASVSPVKTRELLAAGVPVVASDVPELRTLGANVLIARTVDEWIQGIEQQFTRKDREAISESVAGDDWSERVREIRCVLVQRMNGDSEWGREGEWSSE